MVGVGSECLESPLQWPATVRPAHARFPNARGRKSISMINDLVVKS
ncbi:unnamed protein product [Plutella xylostella]|uniref:(diamondback moth) hypothetical protein n=1 Tax=Plutella xylostella TaxID=51655 RepID=A0A8S4CYV6_PLUXY|nr:unnamed protein product [Plutella xylostella]